MTTQKTISQFQLKKIQTEFLKTPIRSSHDAAEYARQFYQGDMEIFESSFILMLSRANETIGYAKISQGGIVGTVIDPRIVCKYAVDSLATGIILFHNHPSGNKRPSDQDVQLTKKVKQCLELLDVKLYDHVILTVDMHYSFADEGIL